MANKSFMLVADDYALSPAVSLGIREALLAGRLSGTGAMTNRPSWPQAARELQAEGLAGLAGLHLNLTCGAPLTAMDSFAPACAFPVLKPVLAAARRGTLPGDEIAGEIKAQLDAFCDALGRAPAYVDGHQHIQALPQIREILLEELARRGWQKDVWLRDSADGVAAILRRRIEPVKALAVAYFGRGFSALARQAGFETNRGFSGFSNFAPSGGYKADFARYLVAPGERHLVMCHPGHVDQELRAADPHTLSREKELGFLLSPSFDAALAAAGMQLAPLRKGAEFAR